MDNFKHTKTFFFFLSCLIIACLFTNGTVLAQTTLATVQGVVTDEEGEALPGAGIVVRNIETGYMHSSVTRSDGTYIISGIQPGRYEMEVKLSGFVTQIRKGMTFAVGASLSIDFVVKPATVEEEIIVTAEAPLIEMTKSDISSVIDRQKIEDLPLMNRNFSDLTILQAGVLDGRSNALQPGGNEMLVDGISNEELIQNSGGQYLPADAIQEFRIMTNNATAEFGNAAGMIRSAITRSGTNEFQGRLNYFYRDETLGTPNYFVNHAEYKGPELPKDQWEKAPYSRHNFGGFLGGPIVKDKAHFFLLYEGTQQMQYSTITSPLVARETVEQPYNMNSFFAKLNYQINQKNLLSLRFSASPSKVENVGVGGLSTKERAFNVDSKDFQIVGNWTFFPSNATMNEVRVLVQKSTSDNLPIYPNTYTVNRPSGYFGKDSNFPQKNYADKYQFVENFSLFLASHTIKAGAEFIYGPSGSPEMRIYDPGVYTFLTDAPFNAADPSTYPYTLVGTTLDGPMSIEMKYTFFTPFIQDSWRVSSRLTLNFGLRYNYYDLDGLEIQNGIRHLNPRFGFSWDPVGDGKTSIRGGVGTFTANLHSNPAAHFYVFDQMKLKVKVFPGYPDPSVPNPFMPNIPEFSPPISKYLVGKVTAPWTLQGTIGVHREILTDVSASADFVYAKGYDAIRQKRLNPIIPGTSPAIGAGTRPDPTQGAVTIMESAGKSEYVGLLLNLIKRYSHGWSLNVSYTLSSAKGDTERTGSEAGPWTNDPDCWERAYGRMRNDARHKLTASGTVNIPLGFQLSGIFYYRSAYPWNAVYLEDINKDGGGGDYVDEHRNSRSGYDEMWLNLRISKYINLSKIRLQLFAEAYNVTNRTNFRGLYNIYGSSLFGIPTSAGGPRLIQLGVRFDWR